MIEYLSIFCEKNLIFMFKKIQQQVNYANVWFDGYLHSQGFTIVFVFYIWVNLKEGNLVYRLPTYLLLFEVKTTLWK